MTPGRPAWRGRACRSGGQLQEQSRGVGAEMQATGAPSAAHAGAPRQPSGVAAHPHLEVLLLQLLSRQLACQRALAVVVVRVPCQLHACVLQRPRLESGRHVVGGHVGRLVPHLPPLKRLLLGHKAQVKLAGGCGVGWGGVGGAGQGELSGRGARAASRPQHSSRIKLQEVRQQGGSCPQIPLTLHQLHAVTLLVQLVGRGCRGRVVVVGAGEVRSFPSTAMPGSPPAPLPLPAGRQAGRQAAHPRSRR